MTEAEWVACRDVNALVTAVLIPGRRSARLDVPRAGLKRKVRLFCCACCHRIARLLTDPRDLIALKVAEGFAEKPGTYRLDLRPRAIPSGAVHGAVEGCAITTPHNVLAHLAEESRQLSRPPEQAFADEKAAQADLFRDIFGNPFRSLPFDPAWLAWDGRAVSKLARAIYDERAFGDLSVLADALEEAGCTDDTNLDHLRGPGPHLRGCWALDACLGLR